MDVKHSAQVVQSVASLGALNGLKSDAIGSDVMSDGKKLLASQAAAHIKFLDTEAPAILKEYGQHYDPKQIEWYYTCAINDFKQLTKEYDRLLASTVFIKDDAPLNELVHRIGEAFRDFDAACKLQASEEEKKQPAYDNHIGVKWIAGGIEAICRTPNGTIFYGGVSVPQVILRAIRELPKIGNTAIVCQCEPNGCPVEMVELRIEEVGKGRWYARVRRDEFDYVGDVQKTKREAVLSYFEIMQKLKHQKVMLNLIIPHCDE
jgi:hypothetical protein